MKYTRSIFSFVIFTILLTLGSLLFSSSQAQAQNGICIIEFVKEAIPSDGTDFIFTCSGGINECSGNPNFTLQDGVDRFFEIDDSGQNTMITVAEEVPDGWKLDDISCEVFMVNPNNITFDFNAVQNGVVVTCEQGADPAFATCTFRNEGPPPTIPTLSQWGLIAMAGVLGIVGFMIMRRRKVTA